VAASESLPSSNPRLKPKDRPKPKMMVSWWYCCNRSKAAAVAVAPAPGEEGLLANRGHSVPNVRQADDL